MIIAFPVDKDSGLESSILSDFSSAKKILCYDTETEKLLCTDGYDSEELLRDTGAEAVIVKDIPCGTIAELKKIGIRVYGAKTDIVGEDLKNFLKDEYRQMFSGDCDGSCR